MVRLADEADVAEPEVAKPAVDQLRRRARGGAAEVAADRRARRRGPRCAASLAIPAPDDAAADRRAGRSAAPPALRSARFCGSDPQWVRPRFAPCRVGDLDAGVPRAEGTPSRACVIARVVVREHSARVAVAESARVHGRALGRRPRRAVTERQGCSAPRRSRRRLDAVQHAAPSYRRRSPRRAPASTASALRSGTRSQVQARSESKPG